MEACWDCLFSIEHPARHPAGCVPARKGASRAIVVDSVDPGEREALAALTRGGYQRRGVSAAHSRCLRTNDRTPSQPKVAQAQEYRGEERHAPL